MSRFFRLTLPIPSRTLLSRLLSQRRFLSQQRLLSQRRLLSQFCQLPCNSKLLFANVPFPSKWTLFRDYATKSYPPHRVLLMPALSPTMTQGNIGKWRKRVGERVEPGDVLVEIETDKAQMEFECQEEGYLAKVLIPEGTKEVPVGKPLLVLAEEKDSIVEFADFVVEKEASTKPLKKEEEPSKPTDQITTTNTIPSQVSTNRIFASPLAKNMAKSMGIDLSSLAGSGPQGRIIKSDVQAASTSPPPSFNPSQTTAAFKDIPLSNMRKVIAQRLCESKQAIPHYYLTVDICMDTLLSLRERLNQNGAGKYKLSINDFIIKAAARAMHDIPAVNSSWHETFIRQYHKVDISVAVATEAGLITPIIPDADLKGLAMISQEMRDLATKAKENKLRPEQYQGGTFTISNLGMFGISHFTAIINPPQSCILAIGTTQRRPMPVEEGEKDDGSLKMRSIMSVTMSCDHRVVDGAMGAQWLQYFKKYMEDPITMLL